MPYFPKKMEYPKDVILPVAMNHRVKEVITREADAHGMAASAFAYELMLKGSLADLVALHFPDDATKLTRVEDTNDDE